MKDVPSKRKFVGFVTSTGRTIGIDTSISAAKKDAANMFSKEESALSMGQGLLLKRNAGKRDVPTIPEVKGFVKGMIPTQRRHAITRDAPILLRVEDFVIGTWGSSVDLLRFRTLRKTSTPATVTPMGCGP